jgi:hypothetical protein
MEKREKNGSYKVTKSHRIYIDDLYGKLLGFLYIKM